MFESFMKRIEPKDRKGTTIKLHYNPLNLRSLNLSSLNHLCNNSLRGRDLNKKALPEVLFVCTDIFHLHSYL